MQTNLGDSQNHLITDTCFKSNVKKNFKLAISGNIDSVAQVYYVV